jgi:hypothetical protein
MTDEVWELLTGSIKCDFENEDKKFITLDEFLLWFHHKDSSDFLEKLKELKITKQADVGLKYATPSNLLNNTHRS